MIKRVFVTAAALCALVFPSSASAWQQWFWTGNLGPGDYDPDCIWYYGRAVCSGWNYWDDNTLERESQNATILLGYENNSRIRGVYVGPEQFRRVVYPGDLGMGGYLKAHATWWSGTENVNIAVLANANP